MVLVRRPMWVLALVLLSCEGGAAPATGSTTTSDEPSTSADTGSSSTAAGTGSTNDGPAPDAGPEDPPPEDFDWPLLTCDPLVPTHCALPFPSNVFTIADDSTATGRRVVLPATSNGDLEPGPWSALDGFSPSAAVMAHLPGASAIGLPGPEAIDVSTGPESPTILLDAESGERIPHFAEIDRSTSDASRSALFLRPARRLAPARRYIVALRNIVDAAGTRLPPSEVFAALRDGTELPDEPSVASRRALYADIFARLEDSGTAREDLQLAWDFTTASDSAVTAWLVHMRDDALARSDAIAATLELDAIDEDWDPQFAYRIEGHFDAPLYLDGAGAGGRLRLGPDGLPEAQGTIEVPFTMIIPQAAREQPVALLQHGHGLFGGRDQIEADTFKTLAVEHGYAVFAVDWTGMSVGDSVPVALAIANGDTNGLVSMFDRLHQGTLHQLLAMRVLSSGLAADPMFADLLDAQQRYYYGISQGGILGGVYMALSTDVTRGVLDVMGQPYNLLLTRSVDFEVFFTVMRVRWPDPLDVMYALAAVQMLWDRVEPSGWSAFVRDPLPGTPAHEVLITAAIGDHQVTTLGAHVAARSIDGLVHLDTGIRPIWGLEAVSGPHVGSALAEYAFGLPPDPPCNLPQTACNDPHGLLRNLDGARLQIDTFLRDGVVENFCPNEVCDFPDAAGCAADAQTPAVCD